MPASSLPDPEICAGWRARLLIKLTQGQGRKTLLSHVRHQGPLQVQRPFYPEPDGTCHIYLLHPPGGIVGGDSLRVEAVLGSRARALVTTPAAGKFYRSSGATSHQNNLLDVADGAALEWLPQESILFQGARVRARTRVELAGSGRFLGWEILCLGRPAAAEAFAHGICRQSFEIFRDGLPLYLDNSHYEGGSRLLSEAWGLHGFPVVGSLLCTNAGTGVVDALRAGLGPLGKDELLSFTRVDDVLVGRYRGLSAGRARQLFSDAWTLIRPALMGKPAVAPRIWNT